MIITKKCIVFFLLLSYGIILNGYSKEIYSFDEAQELLDQADEKTVVLFDVDETLIDPLDAILCRYYGQELGQSLKDSFMQKIENHFEYFWSKILLQAAYKVVEPNVLGLIKNLHSRKVKVLGLTFIRPGKFGSIDSSAEYRFNQLYQFGIDFRPSWDKTIFFTQFSQAFDTFPCVYKGIIMTNNYDKGKVLGAFIDHLDYIPSKIIFFDDWLQHLVAVEQEMAIRNIPCYTFHYRAVEHEAKNIECDYAMAQFQLDYLYQHEVWLSEAQARELLAKGAYCS